MTSMGILWAFVSCFMAQEGSLSWDEITTHLAELPQRQEQAAKRVQLEAELDRLASSYQPQVEMDVNASRTTNPVGVFAGRLGNDEFEMEHFGIFLPDGTVDTTPVNNPDAYSDAVFSVQMGYRLWDGRTRFWQKQQLLGYLDAQNLQDHHIWQGILAEYAKRMVRLETLHAQSTKAKEVVDDTKHLVDLLGALVQEGQLPKLSHAMGQTTLSQSQAAFETLQAQTMAAEKSLAAWLAWPKEKVASLPLPPRLNADEIQRMGYSGESFAERSARRFADAEAHKPQTIADYWQPLVDGFAAYENHQLSQDNWTVGVKATWKIWDGRAKVHERAKLLGEAEEARASMKKTTRHMEQARASLMATLEAMDAQIEALKSATETAREAWRMHQHLLDEGQLEQGTVFEVRRQLLELEQQLLAVQGQQQMLCWQALLLSGRDLERHLRGEEHTP